MANQDVLIKKGLLEKTNGVAVFDLEKYQAIERLLQEYKEKEKLLRNLSNFENLSKWGRAFAGKKKITKKLVLEND